MGCSWLEREGPSWVQARRVTIRTENRTIGVCGALGLARLSWAVVALKHVRSIKV
jgi:hypothetical protein